MYVCTYVSWTLQTLSELREQYDSRKDTLASPQLHKEKKRNYSLALPYSYQITCLLGISFELVTPDIFRGTLQKQLPNNH